MSLPEVTIYTDGASSGKSDSPGGWAAILVYGSTEYVIMGHDPKTTNQRMEMLAAIRGLQALTRPCRVHLVSDSAYLVNCVQQHWHRKWKRNGWRNAKGKAVSNRDLWEELLLAIQKHEVTFEHVKGHAGHEYNERCDLLAVEAKKNGAYALEGANGDRGRG